VLVSAHESRFARFEDSFRKFPFSDGPSNFMFHERGDQKSNHFQFFPDLVQVSECSKRKTKNKQEHKKTDGVIHGGNYFLRGRFESYSEIHRESLVRVG
jgi:hypothetical protein